MRDSTTQSGTLPDGLKIGKLTEALQIKVLDDGRTQITVLDKTVTGEDLQDALAQVIQVLILESYADGHAKGYAKARD